MNVISKHQFPDTSTSDEEENRINQTSTPTSKIDVDIESIVYGFGNGRDLWDKTSKNQTQSGVTPISSRPWASPSSVTDLKFGNGTRSSQFFPEVNPQQQQDGNKLGYDDDRDDNDDSAEPTFDSLRSEWESAARDKASRDIVGPDGEFEIQDDEGNCNRQESEQDGVVVERGRGLSKSSTCVSNDGRINIDTSAETKCKPVLSDFSEMCRKEGNEVKEAVDDRLQELLQEESDQSSELKTTIDPIDVPTDETFSSGEHKNTEVRSANQDKVEDSIANENGFTKVEQMMILEDKDNDPTDLNNLPYRHKEAPSSDEENPDADVSKSNEDDKVLKSKENHSFALGQPGMELTTSDDAPFRNETAQNALLKEHGSPALSPLQVKVEMTAQVTSLCQSDHGVFGKDVEETHLTTDEEQKRTLPSKESSSLEAHLESTFSVKGVEDDRTATEEGASEDVVSVTDEELNATDNDEAIAKKPKISLDLQPIENVDEAVFDEENENQMRKSSIEKEQTEMTKDKLKSKELSKADSSLVPSFPSSEISGIYSLHGSDIHLPANKVFEKNESTSNEFEAVVTERYEEGECDDTLNHERYDPEAVEKVVTARDIEGTVDNVEDIVNHFCRVSNLDVAETNEEEHLVEDETSHTSSEEYSSDMMECQFSNDMMDPLQQSEVNVSKQTKCADLNVNDNDPSPVMTDQAEVEVTQSCLKPNDEDEVFYGSANFHDTGKLRESAAEDVEETDANETNEDNKYFDEKTLQDRLRVRTEQERSLKEEYPVSADGLVANKVWVSFEEDNTNEDDHRQLSGGESSKTIENDREQNPIPPFFKDEYIESYGETSDDTGRKPKQLPQSSRSMSFRTVKEFWEERIFWNSLAKDLFEHESFSFENDHFINSDADQTIQNEHFDERRTLPEPEHDCNYNTEPQQKSKWNETFIIEQNKKQNKKEGELESSSISTAPSTDTEHFSPHRADFFPAEWVESGSVNEFSVEIPPDTQCGTSTFITAALSTEAEHFSSHHANLFPNESVESGNTNESSVEIPPNTQCGTSPFITAAPSTKAEHFSPYRANFFPTKSDESSNVNESSVEKPHNAPLAPKSKTNTIVTKGPVYSCTSMRAIVLEKLQKTFSPPSYIALVPDPTSIVAKGPIYSRTSMRTIVLKKWVKSFFVQYGPTSLYLFRSEEDFGDWLQNPFLSQKQRDNLIELEIDFMEVMSKPNVRGCKMTDLKAKVYERNGPKMHNFKLEKSMDSGSGIVAAFASPQEEEVTKIRNVVSNCLRNCPEFAPLMTIE